MKNNLWLKIAIAHACTFAVTSSFAYLPDTLTNHHRWYAALAVTDMQPSNNNYSETLAGPSSNSTLVNADYQPGVNVLFGYFFTDQDDLSINYTYSNFSNSHSSSDNTAPTAEASGFFNAETVHYDASYNSVIASLGHYITTQSWNTHLYGGLDYTRVTQHSTQEGTHPDLTALGFPNIPPTNIRTELTLNGIGPQIGFETGFRLPKHFSVVGGLNLALLATNLYSYNTSNTRDVAPKTYNVAIKGQANIGLAYQQIISNNYPLSVELGYKGTIVQNQVNLSGSTYDHAFSMHGPYLSVGLDF
jgi:hypothetical protein